MTSAVEPPLVLLAHGSPDPRHRRGVDALAERVRRLAPGRRVAAAYLDHHAPSPSDTAAEVGSGVVVPVLLTRAYHARVDIPAAITSMGEAFSGAAPLGPDQALLHAAGELLVRAGEVPDPQTSVVLYAAGASDSAAVASIVGTVAAHPQPGWAPWAVAALDGGLTLPQVLDGQPEERRVVAVAFMVAEGILRDRMAQACRVAGIPLVDGALGDTDATAKLALHRAASAPG